MIKPKKSLGQNFLLDNNIINKIISLIKINNEKIIEIGPGLGSLTDKIIKLKPKELILIEKDKKIYNLLLTKYKNSKITILNEDVLNFNFEDIYNYIIISNLPYNISSKFLVKIFKFNKNIKLILCMIQSELADKFSIHKSKINKYNFLSEFCCKYKIHFKVTPNVFYPKPKINSKVVTFNLKKQKINCNKLEYFFNFFFIHKRKKIKSNKYFKNQIKNKFLDKRYEDLTYLEISEIYKFFKF